jgi:hypothetical protein
VKVSYFPSSGSGGGGVVPEEVELSFVYNSAMTDADSSITNSGPGPAQPSSAAATALPVTTTTSQQATLPNATTTATPTSASIYFQSTDDSFSIQVPQGWIIDDLNNTGVKLSEEGTRGYGLLAQLCPMEESQQQGVAFSTNAGDSNTNSSTSNGDNSCQGAQEVIHVIRYPDLVTRIQPGNNVTAYHLQKLQEVGYNVIQSANGVDREINLTNPQTSQIVKTIPSKFVEMKYTTATAPNEARTGYYILTATNGTAPNATTIKGYALFYEGNSINGTTSPTLEVTPTTFGSLAPTSLPPVVGQIFGSFELIAAAGVGSAATFGQSFTETPSPGTNTTGITGTTETTEEGAGDGGDGDGGDGDGDGGDGDGDGGDGDGDGGDGDGDGA